MVVCFIHLFCICFVYLFETNKQKYQGTLQKSTTQLLLITTLVLVVSSGNTSGATTSEGRVLGELDVLLRVHVNHEGGGVHDLATDANVSLSDQDASVVDRLGKTELEHLGLKSAVHQLGGAQLQNVVELLLLLGDQSQTSHAADDGSSLEDSAGVLLVQSEELTSSLHHYNSQLEKAE